MDAILEFNVSNQIITRIDEFKTVSDSVNYLYAHFNFLTDDWSNAGTPTAIFTNDETSYEVILDTNNTCLVPHEVLATDDRYIFVSVFAGDRITANTAKVFVIESGWSDDLESSTPPTPSVYDQIIDRMDDIEDAVIEATQRTETAADKAELAVEHYPKIVDGYWVVWDTENEEFVNTDIKAEAHDGTSATVTVNTITGGHRVIITDVSGEHIFDVPDGKGIVNVEKIATSGDVDTYRMTFTYGDPVIYYVTNGVSSTISTQDIYGGHRLTITDKNGTRTVDVMDGATGGTGNGIYSIAKTAEYQNVDYYTITYTNGTKTMFSVTNGFSPIVTITSVTGGHRITITDVNGDHTFDVMDGSGAGGTLIHICSSSEYDTTTRVPTIQNPNDNMFYLVPAEEGASHDMFVEWVYTNNAWEMFGSASIDLSDYATKAEVDGKVDKITGKGLSTNDYTTAEKTKLNGIATGAEVNVQSDWNQSDTSADDYIKNKPTIPSPVTVDSAMSSSSTNPVQNRVVKQAIDDVVIISAQQPSSTTNDIWIDPDGEEVEIPTVEELSDVIDDLRQKPSLENSTKTGVDLDVSDEDGNVLMRLADGEVETKNFDSKASAQVLTGSGVADLDVSDPEGNVVLRVKNGHIMTANFTSEDILARTTYITVKKDGSGDYATLRGAIEYINGKGDADPVEHPYVIQIYPGTYNLTDEYTQTEIEAADVSDYHNGFVGWMLNDGMSLVGVGSRDSIILACVLDTSIYNQRVRGNVSTLNTEGTVSLENLTVIAQNARYCVHDDFVYTGTGQYYRYVKNCKFIGKSLAHSPACTWGGGMSGQGENALYENCDFGTDYGHHFDASKGVVITFKNCRGRKIRLAERLRDVFHYVNIEDSDFDMISLMRPSGVTAQHILINANGCDHAFVSCYEDDIVLTGAITKTALTSLPVGTMVSIGTGSGNAYASISDKSIADGIVVASDTYYSYIQRTGYINTRILEMTGFSLGDYITIDSNNKLVQGGTASNAVGQITFISQDSDATDQGIGFIKLFIGGKNNG